MGNWIEREQEEPFIDITNLNDDIFGTISFPTVELPLDKDGFVKSFTIDQEEEYLKFFDEYGFVVIDNIIDKEEYEESIDEIWKILESKPWSIFKDDTMVSRDDPKTWTDNYFPSSKVGLFDMKPATTKTAWKYRQSEKMYGVFSKLYNKKDLWVSMDRFGIMRPTKKVPDGKLKPVKARWIADEPEDPSVPLNDMDNWKTINNWLHWDLNPWAWTGSTEGEDYTFMDFIIENNGSRNIGDRKLQGLIAFTESGVNDGGFTCVPGFHKHLKEWAEKTGSSYFAAKSKRNFGYSHVPSKDCLIQQSQKITCRAGSLIVWSSELPHCNHPSESNRFRFNFYVKMFPAQKGGMNTEVRQTEMKHLTKNVEVTEHGKKVLGLDY